MTITQHWELEYTNRDGSSEIARAPSISEATRDAHALLDQGVTAEIVVFQVDRKELRKMTRVFTSPTPPPRPGHD